MNRPPISDRRIAVFGPLVGGCFVLAAALALLPSGPEIAAATRRATEALDVKHGYLGSAAATIGAIVALPEAPEKLALRFDQGKPLSNSEFTRLLAFSTKSADADRLSAIADRIGTRDPHSTAQIVWDILASGRPVVAREFLELRPDRASGSLWRLRFELHRRTHNSQFAQSLVREAAMQAGTAPPQDLIEAAIAMDMPEPLVAAAERGVIPTLSRTHSLDLARRAARTGRTDLIARIDRAGTPRWREDDPWLAINLAQRSGDIAGALRYSALLGSGQDAARNSIVIASGDRPAIRAMLLAQAQSATNRRSAIAQQLIEAGFRADGIAVLRLACTGRAAEDPACHRLLYLMGPRPDAESLAWLRSRGTQDSNWLENYVEREKPAIALAFVESQPDSDGTEMLLRRVKLASAARDRQASARALTSLLDGRELTGGQLSAAAAHVPPKLHRRFAVPLARARIAAGAAAPSDRLDLAWDAWNQGKPKQAAEQLRPYLQSHPDDQAALRLMADVEEKLRGKKAARPWLEKVLAETPLRSQERAEILERLGRNREAIALVETLRQDSPGNARLELIHARLLVATGDPGRARKVLRQ